MRYVWYSTIYMFIRMLYEIVLILYFHTIYNIFVHVSIIYLKTSIRTSLDDLYTTKDGTDFVIDMMYKLCTT